MDEPAGTFAIIGAGMAGLAMADTLSRVGRSVVVFEKSRGLGGRIATRREAGFQFDHGAQYVTARGTDFAGFLREAERAGAASAWAPRINGEGEGLALRQPRHVGVPGMSGLVAPFAAVCEIRKSVRIVALQGGPGAWQLLDEAGATHGPFKALALAIPQPQAMALLGHWGTAFPELAIVQIAPCWAVMAAVDGALDSHSDILSAPDHGIAYAGREASKPGRPKAPEAWVIQASPDYSRVHLEADADTVAADLWAGFTHVWAPDAKAVHLRAHRWRYALVERPLGQPYVWDAELGLGLAGDWCIAARVEAAFDSGRGLAEAILATT